MINIKNKSHSVTAELDGSRWRGRRRDRRAGRRVRRLEPLRQGGKPTYCYNLFGIQRFKVAGDTRDPTGHAPGADGVRLRRRWARQGRHRRALHRRQEDRRGPRRGHRPMLFSADETCDVGSDTASPVSDDYTPESSRSTARSTGCRSTSPTRPRPRPPHHPGGAPQDRDGATVGPPEIGHVPLARAGRAHRRRLDQPRPRRARRARCRGRGRRSSGTTSPASRAGRARTRPSRPRGSARACGWSARSARTRSPTRRSPGSTRRASSSSSTRTGKTGIALILVDDAGENQIVVVPGANAACAADLARRRRALSARGAGRRRRGRCAQARTSSR